MGGAPPRTLSGPPAGGPAPTSETDMPPERVLGSAGGRRPLRSPRTGRVPDARVGSSTAALGPVRRPGAVPGRPAGRCSVPRRQNPPPAPYPTYPGRQVYGPHRVPGRRGHGGRGHDHAPGRPGLAYGRPVQGSVSAPGGTRRPKPANWPPRGSPRAGVWSPGWSSRPARSRERWRPSVRLILATKDTSPDHIDGMAAAVCILAATDGHRGSPATRRWWPGPRTSPASSAATPQRGRTAACN
jgi:hypothetical protein